MYEKIITSINDKLSREFYLRHDEATCDISLKQNLSSEIFSDFHSVTDRHATCCGSNEVSRHMFRVLQVVERGIEPPTVSLIGNRIQDNKGHGVLVYKHPLLHQENEDPLYGVHAEFHDNVFQNNAGKDLLHLPKQLETDTQT